MRAAPTFAVAGGQRVAPPQKVTPQLLPQGPSGPRGEAAKAAAGGIPPLALGGLAAAAVAAASASASSPRRARKSARSGRGQKAAHHGKAAVAFVAPRLPGAGSCSASSTRPADAPTQRRAVDPDTLNLAAAFGQLVLAASDPAAQADALQPIKDFFFDSSLQYRSDGSMLLDPRGDPLPDNLWTQYVAVQATLIERLDQTLRGVGISQSFGLAVVLYTLGIRTILYPIVKSQLETTAKIKVLTPRVNELKEQFKDDEERLNQEVGMLYMDLQIDPLAAIIPLLVQLPIFWGLYRGVRRLGIVEYDHLKEPFLWIPSLYGPNFQPDPSFDWLTKWQGPLVELHPKMGWESFGLYSLLPLVVVASYTSILSEAANDKESPQILKAFPFLLGFICCELPQAMGLYIATNIASSVALTQWTTNSISDRIPGYDEYVKTGKWPAGVDPEKVIAKAFGVQRLTDEAGSDFDDPNTVPEAIFAGRADYIPELIAKGRAIDEFDDRGIPASFYSLAMDKTDLLERLFELGADPCVRDEKGNTLLHYMAGYGRANFLPMLLETGLKDLLNDKNMEDQTPLDVARVNLQAEKVADMCEGCITALEKAGAEGNLTTKDDVARFRTVREQLKKEMETEKARDALKAMARMAEAQKAEEAKAKAAEAQKAQPDDEEGGAKGMLEGSLDRVKGMDIEALRERLGGMLTEDQLKKVMARLEKMTPEDLARYASGLPSVKADAEPGNKAEAKESVLID